MISKRRILASPTPEGKAASAKFSLSHGSLAKSVVLERESKHSFKDLVFSLDQVFAPADDHEVQLVATMAVARWRLMRIWSLEKASLDHEIAKNEDTEIDEPTRAALAFRSLCDGSRSLDLLSRYEVRYDRQFARSYNLLQKHRHANGTACPLPTVLGPALPPEPEPKPEPQPPTPPPSTPPPATPAPQEETNPSPQEAPAAEAASSPKMDHKPRARSRQNRRARRAQERKDIARKAPKSKLPNEPSPKNGHSRRKDQSAGHRQDYNRVSL